MARVLLEDVWINDGIDPSDYRWFHNDKVPDDSRTADVEVRTYAGGRRRIVRRPGKAGKMGLSLVLVSAADVAWLEDHMGKLVVVRDQHGRRMWGTYASLEVSDYLRAEDGSEVTLTVESVTYVEGA